MAATAVASVGIGQAMGQGQAQAATLPSLPSPTGTIGDVLDALANNGATQELANQWRFDLCSSDSDGGPRNGGADCTGSTGAGVAVVLPSTIDLVPDVVYKPAQSVFDGLGEAAQWSEDNLGIPYDGTILGIAVPVPDAALPEGAATIIGDGFQFALASGGGQATAISYLPLSLATAGASDGRTAYSFALIGMANAWTTSAIPVEIFTVPVGEIPAIKHVSCYGGITAAYAEAVGACVNIAGTGDFRLDLQQSIPEAQFALTDPSAILFEPADVLTKVLTDLFAGEPFSLSQDFARLAVGGEHTGATGLPSLLRLTSDYGLQDSVKIGWLGSTITLFAPSDDGDDPNYLAFPLIDFGTPTDASQIIPTFAIPGIDFPFGLGSTDDFDSSSLLSQTSAVSTLAATTESADDTITDRSALPKVATFDASDTGTTAEDSPSAGDTSTPVTTVDDTDETYVGKHRLPSLPSYQGRHLAPESPKADTSDDGTSDDGTSVTDTSSNDVFSDDKGSTTADTDSSGKDTSKDASDKGSTTGDSSTTSNAPSTDS